MFFWRKHNFLNLRLRKLGVFLAHTQKKSTFANIKMQTMEVPFYTHLALNIAYVILFAMLGLFTLFIHIPSEEAIWVSYRKSRKTLGGAFLLMTAYCILRSIHPQYLDEYVDFWLLTVVSLLFSWLNYTSFLYLINTEHTIRKHFIIDGLIPISLMIVLGLLGEFLPAYHEMFKVGFGVVFMAKSIRMFYVCDQEWKRVYREQQNYYDKEIDITWMRVLVWLTFALGISSLVALYLPAIHLIYCCAAPLVFVYMVGKVVNYLPRKIMIMRGQEQNSKDEQSKAQASQKANLEAKIGAQVERWVQEKRYCKAELSIKEVAIQIGTNHTYLSQYLNEHLQVTFQTWLNTLRIEESKRILITENIPIEETGIRVGIPESYNFSRWFKVVTGTTPLRYRREEKMKQ